MNSAPHREPLSFSALGRRKSIASRSPVHAATDQIIWKTSRLTLVAQRVRLDVHVGTTHRAREGSLDSRRPLVEHNRHAARRTISVGAHRRSRAIMLDVMTPDGRARGERKRISRGVYQGKTALQAATSRVGIGLSVVTEFVDAHSGSLGSRGRLRQRALSRAPADAQRRARGKGLHPA